MITEPRKQIMKLIEPHMDKTLSEGCLMVDIDSSSLPVVRIMKLLGTWNGKSDILCNDDNRYHSSWFKKNTEYIIWHYDITAVLKYIENIDSVVLWSWEWNFCVCQDDWGDFDNGKDRYLFPKKPLYLYTEEEDKLLLELLQKLWENHKK